MEEKRKGFTLIELLATIVILGIIMLIAVPAMNKYIFKTEEHYYSDLEETVKSAAMDYTSDNRKTLPKNIGSITTIDKKDLIDGKYLEDIVDTSNRSCGAYAVVQKLSKDKYDYTPCISCPDYKSNNQKCSYTAEDNSKYQIIIPDEEEVLQGDREYTLPKARVVLLSVPIGYADPTPTTSFSVDVLGDYTIQYKYRDITKSMIVHVVDRVKPSIPEVQVTYVNGNRYDGTSTSDLKINASSTDLTKYDLQGSGVKEFLVSYDNGSNWSTVAATDQKISISKAGNIDSLWVKAKDNANNESDIRKLSTAIFTDYNGTTRQTRREIAYLIDNKITVPVPSIRNYTNHTIVGWSNSNTGYSKSIEQNKTLTIAPGNYYAVYNRTLTLSYNSNGGSAISSTSAQTKFNSSGNVQAVSINISNTKPTKTGHTFSKWSGGGKDYQPGNTASLTADLTLTASWTANTYKITYNANGGSGAPGVQSYTYASSGTINLSSTKPARPGYVFLGWSLSATATSPSYSAGQAWNRNNASNYTLYAVWKQDVKVIYSPTKGINLLGTSWSIVRKNGAKNKTKFEYRSDCIYAAGYFDGKWGGRVIGTSPNFSTTDFKYIHIQAKTTYSSNVKINGTRVVPDRFNGVKHIDLQGKTSINIVLDAYSDLDGDGYVWLYKVVLSNNANEDISKY